MYFIHLDDPTFERFGGIYIPYATQLEAERQVANDLIGFENDVKAAGILGIFEAEYGGHKRMDDRVYEDGTRLTMWDYNEPHGHLNADERKIVYTPDKISQMAVKHQKNLIEEQKQAAIDGVLSRYEAILALHKTLEAAVPGNAYTVVSGGTSTAGAIALTAATAKTVIGVAAGSANQPAIVECAISFDGVTASAVPVLCEWVSGTNATNAPGTASTSMTAKQIRGWPGQSSQSTAAYNWTTEPTVLEVFKKRLITPNGGMIVQQQPMGREPTGIVTASTQFKFMGLRLTAPATVNCHADLEYEE